MKQRIKIFVWNVVFSAYLAGCIAYIFHNMINTSVAFYTATGILTLLFTFSGSSPVHKLYDECEGVHWSKSFWFWTLIATLIITIAVGWMIVEIDPVKFFTRFMRSKNIVKGLVNPDFTDFRVYAGALAETIFLALLATAFAVPFAFVFSFIAARNLMSHNWLTRIVYYLVRTIATIGRSIEAIVWAIIFSVWVGIGPFAGMLALMIHSIAALTKLFSEQIENIDNGPVDAIKSTGATTLQTWVYAVTPQILTPFLAFTIYRWDINVRMATIVGFVGGGGIGLFLQQQQGLLAWRNVGMIMWMIAATVWIMDMLSSRIRQKLLK